MKQGKPGQVKKNNNLLLSGVIILLLLFTSRSYSQNGVIDSIRTYFAIDSLGYQGYSLSIQDETTGKNWSVQHADDLIKIIPLQFTGKITAKQKYPDSHLIDLYHLELSFKKGIPHGRWHNYPLSSGAQIHWDQLHIQKIQVDYFDGNYINGQKDGTWLYKTNTRVYDFLEHTYAVNKKLGDQDAYIIFLFEKIDYTNGTADNMHIFQSESTLAEGGYYGNTESSGQLIEGQKHGIWEVESISQGHRSSHITKWDNGEMIYWSFGADMLGGGIILDKASGIDKRNELKKN